MAYIALQIPDSIVPELMSKRTSEQWIQFWMDIVAAELRDIRNTAAEAAKPVPEPVVIDESYSAAITQELPAEGDFVIVNELVEPPPEDPNP